MDYPRGVHLAAMDAIGRSDANIRAKLLKRFRKHGLTDQDVAALVEAWKRAADEHERLEGDAFALGGAEQSADRWNNRRSRLFIR